MAAENSLLLAKQQHDAAVELTTPATDLNPSATDAFVQFDATNNAWNDADFAVSWELWVMSADGQSWQFVEGGTIAGGSHGKDGGLPKLPLVAQAGKRFRYTLTTNKDKTFGLNLTVETP